MRGVLALAACGALPLLAQTQLSVRPGQKPSAATPITAPASAFASTGTTAQAATPLTPAQRPAHKAEINYSLGQLAVTADNASLNQILREVGRQTGISISGGVAEERVFGKYGPAPVRDVLATLLDGTGSNLILVAGEGGAPGQLILTPRQGGVTPPNPNAPGFDDDNGGDNEGMSRFRPQTPGISLYGETPLVQGGVPVNAAPVNGVPATGFDPSGSQANPANAVNPQAPNGIKTPQEIMQQLQLLRQQQQQQQPQL